MKAVNLILALVAVLVIATGCQSIRTARGGKTAAPQTEIIHSRTLKGMRVQQPLRRSSASRLKPTARKFNLLPNYPLNN